MFGIVGDEVTSPFAILFLKFREACGVRRGSPPLSKEITIPIVLTADFTDYADKTEFVLIREIRVIRGKKRVSLQACNAANGS